MLDKFMHFVLDPKERLDFLQIDELSLAVLRSFRSILVQHIDALLDDFYHHIGQMPTLANAFAGASVEHARRMQRIHWLDNVFSGNFTDGYFTKVEQIGRAHAKFGVNPRWYMGSYCFIINKLNEIAAAIYNEDPDCLRQTIAAINKVAFLDMEMSMSVYINAGLEHLASYDALTNLPNRRLLLDRLSQLQATGNNNGQYSAVLFVDLDDFKAINEAEGHSQGNIILKKTAQRLQDCVCQMDTVARSGADDFIVILKDIGQDMFQATTKSKHIGNKILQELRKPYELFNYTYTTSASIGITLFQGRENSIEDILRWTDMALYQAKAAGKNNLKFYDQNMQDTVLYQLELDQDLHTAMKEEQFFLLYQAQVNETGHLTGAEALVRWRHPQKGTVSPDKFIPKAEENGVILALGLWVLKTACRQLADWAARPQTSQLTLSVNISSRQFRQLNFAEQVLEVLAETGGNPKLLKLEITESMLVDDIEETLKKMKILTKKGIQFSLDDFGTGYSSLSYLKHFPLAQLKIDKSFVRGVSEDPTDDAIAEAIVGLGRSLKLSIIAEGVENEGQRAFLNRCGCNLFQGYLFGRPVPVTDLEYELRRGL